MTPAEVKVELRPFADVSLPLALRLARYAELLQRWNRVTNLTSLQTEQEIVRRHFGESLFAASAVAAAAETLLDIGSGAGFPGVPIALALPSIRVTLAESHGKKSAFLHEVIRTLEVTNVEVWGGRVEAMPSSRCFDVVTTRAVDRPAAAEVQMQARTRPGGQMLRLCGRRDAPAECQQLPIPGSENRVVAISYRPPVS